MSRPASTLLTASTARLGNTRSSGHHPNHGISISRPRFSHEHHADEKTLLNDTEMHDVDENEDSDDDMLFNWNSEQSLLHDLMDEGPGGSDEDRLDTLIDSLHAPFDEKRKELKKEMAETYVPVMRHVAAVHQALDERVDVPYGKGLKLFNNACKELEVSSLAEYQESVEAYGTIRSNIANIVEQLKAEYESRDQLWQDFERDINELADSAIADIQDTPAQVERTIAKLEKYHQTMDNGKESGVLTDKRVKELLNKLG